MGRSFKVYLLLFGVVLGFAVSTIVQVTTDVARQQQAAPHLGKKQVSLQISVRDDNPPAVGVREEDVRSLELSDYDYNHRNLDDDAKMGVESFSHGKQESVKSPDSVEPSLDVPKPRSLSAKEQEERLDSRKSSSPFYLLTDEFPSRQVLLVGVITSLSKLMTQTLAIQGTWGPRASQVIFFVGDVETLPHLPPKMRIVQLEGVEDGEEMRELKEALAIKYMADQYLNKVDWFMVVGDETYIAPTLLEKKLNAIDARYQIYIGRPGAGGDKERTGKGSLCHRDPGVIYSRAMMESLRQYLPTCWPGGQQGGATVHDCILAMQVSCTQAKEVRVWLVGVAVVRGKEKFNKCLEYGVRNLTGGKLVAFIGFAHSFLRF